MSIYLFTYIFMAAIHLRLILMTNLLIDFYWLKNWCKIQLLSFINFSLGLHSSLVYLFIYLFLFIFIYLFIYLFIAAQLIDMIKHVWQAQDDTED